MTCALISALSNRPIKRDIAMTGEITIKGNILPIGGVKEKILGAYERGIKTLVLPIDNQPEVLREILPNYRELMEEMEIHYCEHLDEVLNIVLLPKS